MCFVLEMMKECCAVRECMLHESMLHIVIMHTGDQHVKRNMCNKTMKLGTISIPFEVASRTLRFGGPWSRRAPCAACVYNCKYVQ